MLIFLLVTLLLPIRELPPVNGCIPGPHELGRVRRLPITPMTTSKPRDPDEDAYPHCEDPFPRERS